MLSFINCKKNFVMNCLGSRERAKSSRKLRYLGQKEKYTDDDFVADINSTLGNPINGSKL